MDIIKINGWYVNLNAISSVKVNEEEDMAVVVLTEVTDGDSQMLHVHGKDAVSYLSIFLDFAVRIDVENDPVPQATIVD